jgi:hypothetical protein
MRAVTIPRFGDAAALTLEEVPVPEPGPDQVAIDVTPQRLVSLSLRLRLLASRLAPGSEAERLLADARNELAAALKERAREIPLAQNDPERAVVFAPMPTDRQRSRRSLT